MRVAALYDIHGNLPALTAVLAEVAVSGADLIIVGGDLVHGPMCGAAIDRLLAQPLPVRWIQGNCEREVLAARAGGPVLGGRPEDLPVVRSIRWVAGELTRAQVDCLVSWPEQTVVEIDGLGPTLFCHGSPRDVDECLTAATPEARLQRALAGVSQPLVVCGHTHIPFDRVSGQHRIVNAGSVGSPFDGTPGACWLLLGPDVEFKRTAYDLAAAAKLIRATDYPEAEEFAAASVLAPPDPAPLIARFEAMSAAREPA